MNDINQVFFSYYMSKSIIITSSLFLNDSWEKWWVPLCGRRRRRENASARRAVGISGLCRCNHLANRTPILVIPALRCLNPTPACVVGSVVNLCCCYNFASRCSIFVIIIVVINGFSTSSGGGYHVTRWTSIIVPLRVFVNITAEADERGRSIVLVAGQFFLFGQAALNQSMESGWFRCAQLTTLFNWRQKS